MKMIFYFLSFVLYIFSNPIYCDDALKNTLDSVRELKGGKELIAKATRGGPITIKTETHFPFEAYWDPSIRTIGITDTNNKAYSLIFELQNAASQKEFDRLDSMAIEGKISKNEYVRAVEEIEYKNTLKTSALIDEGIQLGVLAPDSKTLYLPNFEDHYRDQIRKGHSEFIATSYDNLYRT